MALLHVLWTTAFLALFTAAFGDAAQTSALAARTRLALAQAQAAADGALALGLLAILATEPGQVAQGTIVVPLPDGAARLTIEDEGGKVDLNRAPASVIERLFRAAGAEDGAARTLAQAVLLRRAASSTGRPGFVLPEELGRLDVAPDVLRALVPAVTTISRADVVDPGVAGPVALMAAADLDRGDAERFLRSRATLGRFAPLTGPATAPLTGAGFTLRATAGAGEAVATRVLVVRPVPFSGPLSLAVLDWRTAHADLP